MGASCSHVSELSSSEHLLRLSSTECLSPNDPFWNQLLSFTFVIPRNRYTTDLYIYPTYPAVAHFDRVYFECHLCQWVAIIHASDMVL